MADVLVTLNRSCAGCWPYGKLLRLSISALGLWLVVPCLLGSSRSPAVVPILDYVVDNPAGGYTAWFGYRNRQDRTIRLPVGKENRFTPQSMDRGQPVKFLPGRHRRVFKVDFPRGSLVWHLDGRSATAAPNRRPTVRLTAPLTGTAVSESGELTLKATAKDPDGRVARVIFFHDGTKIGQDTRAPYTQKVPGLAAGDHQFKAVAIDQRDAPSLDSNLVLVKVLGSNQPPTVTLSTPTDGEIFTAPATITLSADAADPDGTIAWVEFFRDGTKLGEVTAAPYEWTWSPVAAGTYSLTAAATDNQGGRVMSGAVTVTVQVSNALPVIANFEPAEGYVEGGLDGQQGWEASGMVNVVTAPTHAGTQAAQLTAESPPVVMERALTATAGSVVYLDIFTRPVAGSTPEAASLIQTAEARVALVRRDGMGEINLEAGDGVGGRAWQATGYMTTLDATGAADWQRYTIREDFGARTWDFYTGGVMLAANLAFAGDAPAGLSGFRVNGHTAAPVALDEFLAAYDNPLFIDADNDGMEDAWETAHGLNPAVNDRDGDADADGLTNITEYVLGTNPGSTDSDGDGMPDGWETQYGFDPAANDAGDDSDHDGVGNLIEFLQGRNPSKGAVADLTGAVNLRLYQPGR